MLLPRLASDCHPFIYASHVAGIPGVYHHPFLNISTSQGQFLRGEIYLLLLPIVPYFPLLCEIGSVWNDAVIPSVG
jgi:hypothetical protein